MAAGFWRARAVVVLGPVPPNVLVRDVEIHTWSDPPELVGETIEISSQQGVFLLLRLHPFETRPEELDGRKVCRPVDWPVTFTLFRADDPGGPTLRHLRCEPLFSIPIDPDETNLARHIGMPAVYGDTRLFLRRLGYGKPPQLPPQTDVEGLYWTFAVPTDREHPAGEYVYEVRLYPTARWVSSVRNEAGEPLVLRRGRLIVRES